MRRKAHTFAFIPKRVGMFAHVSDPQFVVEFRAPGLLRCLQPCTEKMAPEGRINCEPAIEEDPPPEERAKGRSSLSKCSHIQHHDAFRCVCVLVCLLPCFFIGIEFFTSYLCFSLSSFSCYLVSTVCVFGFLCSALPLNIPPSWPVKRVHVRFLDAMEQSHGLTQAFHPEGGGGWRFPHSPKILGTIPDIPWLSKTPEKRPRKNTSGS